MSEGFVYFLISTSGSTYIGATIDLEHRLRQHNREIKGGAHATSMKVLQGEIWSRVCNVRNFPDWSACLQFEWRWKHLSRKFPLKMRPIERRLRALKKLMSLERPTTKAMAYSEWPVPPEIVFEQEDSEQLYNSFL
jgi:predicted GIY-YIG superfamily endonuclease